MRNHVKVLSALLVIILMVSMLPMTTIAANAESGDYDAVFVGESKLIDEWSMDSSGYVIYRFTSNKSGWYSYYTTGDVYDYISVTLYDSDWNPLLTSNASENNESEMVGLEAGETYFFKLESYSMIGSERYFTITDDPILATDISIRQGESYVAFEKTNAKFSYELEPEDAAHERCAWLSSNESVATVDQAGKVSFISPGNTTVSVVTQSGLSDDCEVTVKETPTLSVGEARTDSFTADCPALYYSFTPEKSGFYRFNVSSDKVYTYGYLYDSDMNTLSFLNSGFNYGFRYRLEAGQTYYCETERAVDDQIGQVTVKVEAGKGAIGLEAVTPPDRLEYIKELLYDEIDYSGMSVRILWDDGTETLCEFGDNWNMIEDNYLYTDIDMQTGVLTVSYAGYQVDYQLSLIGNPVDRIEIDHAPTKEYLYGDLTYCGRTTDDNGEPIYYWSYSWNPDTTRYHMLDLTGLEFTVYYLDGSAKKYTWNDLEFGKIEGHDCLFIDNHYFGFNYNESAISIGDNIFTLTYMDHTAECAVKVKDAGIEKIEAVNAPDNADYIADFGFPDWKGLTLKLNYLDGSYKEFTLDDSNWSPFLGYSTFVLNGIKGQIVRNDTGFILDYLGKECKLEINALSTDNVKVKSINVEDFSYETGKLELTVTYADDSVEQISITDPLNQEHMGPQTYLWISRYSHGLFNYSISKKSETLFTIRAFGISTDINTEETRPILGDVDSDGEIMVTDATFIQRNIADIEIPFDLNEIAADTDGDGQVTLMDATYIQRWLVNMKSNDNIGKPTA